MTERVLKDDDVVMVVQCDAIRLIGRVTEQDVFDESDSKTGIKMPFVLRDVGAVLITRGVAPGPIQGTMAQVKQIGIATLDFAEAPLEAMVISKMSFFYTDVMLDPEGATAMRGGYDNFLNRRPSVVQHSRTDGVMP